MTLDRLQAAWRYTNAEIWRPLFDRFRNKHPDLPITVMRTMLDRSPGMRQIFVEPGQSAALDRLRSDVATIIDSPEDARAALRRIRPEFFISGRAIALVFSEIHEALQEFDGPVLTRSYRNRLQRFLQRHMLPYRLDLEPFKFVPLLHGDVDALYRTLRAKAETDAQLQEALCSFEDAWDRQSIDWSQTSAKDAIRMASLLAENVLVSASNAEENEFSKAFSKMRREKRFPSDQFANIFERAYTFANTYPNIRHAGNADIVHRELRKEDTILSAFVFIWLSASAHSLCTNDSSGLADAKVR